MVTNIFKSIAAINLIIFSTHATANMIFPALMYESFLFSPIPITIALIIEGIIIYKLFALTIWRSLIIVTCINLVTAILGIVLVPFLGTAWQFIYSIVYGALFAGVHRTPWAEITVLGTFIIVVLLNTWLEALVLMKGFKLAFKIKSKQFLWLLLANSISAAVAIFLLWIFATGIIYSTEHCLGCSGELVTFIFKLLLGKL